MPEIEIGPDLIQIDADIVAKALRITPQDMQDRMRDGTVTSRFEQGEGEDAGRVRLTFFSDTRRARITADTTGTILTCSAVDFTRTPRNALPETRSSNPDNDDKRPERARLEGLLDEALQGTFPASDPIALAFDTPDGSKSRAKKSGVE